ncbi:hypothetical protein E4T38_08844 [Aureobasidium subglaciale]|nr:hypothetical protein E4T38_08844 [Aureobasidium subglaciale]KAI5214772.1 hypothetical protein E4T40_08801 [Aureobasidium subglaciale]KAI5217719.1 hypothetical protein E4T41_08711 [Aureobasidium subglaciale]KAI5255372.1 hypothetical protein E4T46_08745 [Aureobasidium subglaciale]
MYTMRQIRPRVFQDDDLVSSLREEIVALRIALSKANASNIGYAAHDFALDHSSEAATLTHTSQLVLDSENQNEPLGGEHAFESRSSQAMNELSSLMLQLDVADIGEPSFTLSSHRTPQELVPDTSGLSREARLDGETTVSQDDRRQLLKCFSETFNRFHQFLDLKEALSWSKLDLGSQEVDLEFRNYALLAVAASCSDLQRLRDMQAHFSTHAESLVLRCIKERASDLVVQGLALLAWIELKVGSDSMAYNWIAMATGQVLHLGLHASALKSTKVNDGQDQIIQQRRIRSFWAYFSVDRLVTSSLGMNCTMHWQRVKCPSFTSILPATPFVDEQAHERFCEMWHLWDSCMDQGQVVRCCTRYSLYAFGWYNLSRPEKEKLVSHSHQTMTRFHAGNNVSLQIFKDNMTETAVWLEVAYNAALILIHRPLLSEASSSKAGRFSLTVATTAASAISRIVRDFGATHDVSRIAPQIIDYVSIAAIMHLLNATSGRNRLGRQSANGLRICVQALSAMVPRWEKRASSSLRHIQNLARRWEVVWALPLQYSRAMPPQSRVQEDSNGLQDMQGYGALNSYNVFNDAALDVAAETLWGSEGIEDQDWILHSASNLDGQANIWDLDWQLLGE